MVLELTPEQTQEALAAHPMIILSFGAPWCIDCRRAEPFYKKLSENYPQVTFTKIDISDREEVRPLFKIQHIPTMIFYKDGVEIDRVVEVPSPSTLKTLIEECLAKAQ